MGSIYYQLGPTQIFDKMAGLSFAGVMVSRAWRGVGGALIRAQVIFLCFHLILSFSTDRLVWLRDRDNGLYGAMEYYWSIVLAGLPGDLMGATILATILYWMMVLRVCLCVCVCGRYLTFPLRRASPPKLPTTSLSSAFTCSASVLRRACCTWAAPSPPRPVWPTVSSASFCFLPVRVLLVAFLVLTGFGSVVQRLLPYLVRSVMV